MSEVNVDRAIVIDGIKAALSGGGLPENVRWLLAACRGLLAADEPERLRGEIAAMQGRLDRIAELAGGEDR